MCGLPSCSVYLVNSDPLGIIVLTAGFPCAEGHEKVFYSYILTGYRTLKMPPLQE
jgi:hypothetical protein